MHHAHMSAIDAMPQRISIEHAPRKRRALDEVRTTSVQARTSSGENAFFTIANADN
jgi:hypothetical protein